MKGKRALVVGMARSGIAAAELLLRAGAAVRLSDIKSEDSFGATLDSLRVAEAEFRLGEPAVGLLDGVDMVVISPGIPIDHPVVAEANRRGIEVLGELELSYRLGHGKLIAITGTNGKTTTTTLTGEIFKNAGKRTFVVGNIGYPYAAIAGETREDDVVVCEVSSFQLESIRDYRPVISAILNITQDHLNRHGTMRHYIELKARVFENETGMDCVVLNYDDAVLRVMAEDAKCRVLWFSRTRIPPEGAFVSEGSVVYGTAEQFKTICAVGEIGIPGPHNLENALAATAIAMAAEVPPPVIRHSLKTFKGVEHRLEFVRELDGVRYINDSKGTNVDSTLKAIASMERPTVLILGGYDKHVDMQPLGAAIAAQDSPIKRVVLVGEMARSLEETLKEAGYANFAHAGYDFALAVEMAREAAQAGDNVLLSPACASFDMFKDFEQRGEAFKKLVHALESRAV